MAMAMQGVNSNLPGGMAMQAINGTVFPETMSIQEVNRTLFPEAVSPDRTFVCHAADMVESTGFFRSETILHYSAPLLLLQFSLLAIVAAFIDVCIKPFGLSLMISQVLGGIVFGPSVLGHKSIAGEALFPPRGMYIFETAATFGLVLFIFIMSVHMDSKLVLRPNGKAFVLSACSLLIPIVLAVSLTFILKPYVSSTSSVSKSLPLLAAIQSWTSFADVFGILCDLKMLQSDIGRIAIRSALTCDVIGFLVVVSIFSVLQTLDHRSLLMPVLSVLVTFFFIFGPIFILRPIIQRTLRGIPEGKSVKEFHIMFILISLLLLTFVGELIGQHFPFGPTVIGFLVPEGPPLGTALVDKLELPVAKILFPAFLTISGIKTNIFSIKFESLWVMAVIVVSSFFIKIAVVTITACYMDIDYKQSLVLGLIFNSKGVFEIIMYNLLMDAQLLTTETFSLCMLSMVIVTAIVTPLIKFFHKSQLDVPVRRRTIQHTKRDTELRIMVCIHNPEEVPSYVNLLTASNATDESPVAVIALLLVQLVGRAAAMLTAHQSHITIPPSHSRSGHIINALRQYELYNETCVILKSFSSISHYDTMYEDVCRVALDQNVTIIILPFHKRWEIDGSIGSINRSIQQVNASVVERATCSVGILVDRRILDNSVSVLNGQASFNVAVIYIGGPDDTEALAYGARMAGHPRGTVTLIRFLMFGYDNARDRKIDNQIIDEVRRGNYRLIYQEQIMRDSVELAAAIRGLGISYDLILVGKHHEDSPLVAGLGAWIDCPELGAIGDLLAEPQLETIASVLVVQQQRIKAKFIHRTSKPVVSDLDPFR